MASVRVQYPDGSIATLTNDGEIAEALQVGAALISDASSTTALPTGGPIAYGNQNQPADAQPAVTQGNPTGFPPRKGTGLTSTIASVTGQTSTSVLPGNTLPQAIPAAASTNGALDLVPAPPVQQLVETQADGLAFIGGAVGGPVGLVIGSIADFVLGLFGLFGGGIPKAVASALSDLRDGLVQLGKELIHIGQVLAAAVAAVLAALKKVYEKVIKPILDKLGTVAAKIGKIIDKVLKPYLDWMQKIRKLILEIYSSIFLPIITMLQNIRKALALLKILHVPGVQKLDAKIQKIQGKLIGVIDSLLQKTNDHAGILNTIVTAKMILQHGVFLNSAYVYQGQMQRLWWDGQTRELTGQESVDILQSAANLNPAAQVQALQTLLATGDGSPPVPQSPDEQALLNLLQGRPS